MALHGIGCVGVFVPGKAGLGLAYTASPWSAATNAACCLFSALQVGYCMLSVARCPFASCPLHVHVVCRTLSVICSHVVRCMFMLVVARCLLYLFACCLSSVACCPSHVAEYLFACCPSRVVRCMLHDA